MFGAITGLGTALGGMLRTFPFLISSLPAAPRIAYTVVVVELLSTAFIILRRKLLHTYRIDAFRP